MMPPKKKRCMVAAIIRSTDLGFPLEVARGGWRFTSVMPSRRVRHSKHLHHRLRTAPRTSFHSDLPRGLRPAACTSDRPPIEPSPPAKPAPHLHQSRIGGKRNSASLQLRSSIRTTRSQHQIERLLLPAPCRQEPPPTAVQVSDIS
jgi:hypothetical protein